MIRGLYTAATGMQTQQNRMDVVTNNLANAGTAGYKQDTLLTRSFREALVSRLSGPAAVGGGSEVGPLGFGLHVDEIHTSFSAGALRETGLPTDMAIIGDGFFAVQTPAGERYTRAGNFRMTADGSLATADGYRVAVSAVRPEQPLVVRFADNRGLRKEGNNLYVNTGTEMIEAGDAEVRRGFLESSNVDLTAQVVDMIGIQRNFELNAKIIKMMDERLGRAVNDIGKL